MDEVSKSDIDETMADPEIALRAAVASAIGAHRRLVAGGEYSNEVQAQALLWLEIHERLAAVKASAEAQKRWEAETAADSALSGDARAKAYELGFQDGRQATQMACTWDEHPGTPDPQPMTLREAEANAVPIHKAHADSELGRTNSGNEDRPVT